MARPKLQLKKKSANCHTVIVRGPTQYGNPIGTICKVSDGFTYTSFPSPTTKRGPKRTKKSAVLAVVKDYQSWIGLGPGKVRY